MDWQKYTDRHTHPSDDHTVEIVAYERRAAGWDVFVFEPAGSCPELDENCVDDNHIFFTTVESANDIDEVAAEIDRRLGEPYVLDVYYREHGGRLIIGQIQSHLGKHGAHHIWVHSVANGDWELVIRRKDFCLASQCAASNVRR